MSTLAEMVTELVIARKARRWTQRDLADDLNRWQNVISAWEAGTTAPTVDSLARWADSLGFDLELVPREGKQ